jgi:hypothetical protein
LFLWGISRTTAHQTKEAAAMTPLPLSDADARALVAELQQHHAMHQWHRALFTALDALVLELRALPPRPVSSGNGYVEHFVSQAEVWRWADRLAAELATYRERR